MRREFALRLVLENAVESMDSMRISRAEMGVKARLSAGGLP
jgi:hypothetical protein